MLVCTNDVDGPQARLLSARSQTPSRLAHEAAGHRAPRGSLDGASGARSGLPSRAVVGLPTAPKPIDLGQKTCPTDRISGEMGEKLPGFVSAASPSPLFISDRLSFSQTVTETTETRQSLPVLRLRSELWKTNCLLYGLPTWSNSADLTAIAKPSKVTCARFHRGRLQSLGTQDSSAIDQKRVAFPLPFLPKLMCFGITRQRRRIDRDELDGRGSKLKPCGLVS